MKLGLLLFPILKNYLFILERGEWREKEREWNIKTLMWERNIDMLPLAQPQPRIWPTTQACTLTGNLINAPPCPTHRAAPVRAIIVHFFNDKDLRPQSYVSIWTCVSSKYFIFSCHAPHPTPRSPDPSFLWVLVTHSSLADIMVSDHFVSEVILLLLLLLLLPCPLSRVLAPYGSCLLEQELCS